ncbi:uncharacterized protein LY89DRAFT_122628 [Mollisia scopiformis]|uniref:C2H2-type domain-containing protein n=1 Tax=Mollisia scopiformis TaxID=149040 RepID=A0A194X4Q9_MOLSC|nr:uncharacterized protein LY89DRAFT_122628 [Mollisia scopiformis]KUJ14802.1 hypothetical protein LY89DRAFT_122628 [Mollisia scopiformis]
MGRPRVEVDAGPDPLPSELLEYNPAYRILLCTSCKYAIQPSGIDRHLKEIHLIKRSRRRPFTEYVSKLSLASPEEVFQSPIQQFPIPGLPVLDGLRCEQTGCGHLCVSEKRMRSHWVGEHGRQGDGKDGDWTEARLQTFFRGNLLRYFSGPEEDKFDLGEEPWLPNCPNGKCRGEKVASKGLTGVHSEMDASWIEAISEDILVQSIADIHVSLNDNDSLLLQHYLNHTAATIATDAATLRLWQDAVPKLAQSNPFLHHGILAISALHLAYVTPNSSPLYNDYLLSATSHQDAAIPVYRTKIADVTPENSHAVFMFSHLLVLYCLASESQDERLFIVGPTNDGSPIWLHFLRAGCGLLCHVWDDLEAGPVKSLASAWDIPVLEVDAKTPLVDNLLSFIPSDEEENGWSEDEKKIYTETARLLGLAFLNAAVGVTFSTWDALRIWPMCVTSEYLQLLKAQHPGALVLLAHYCVLLKRLEGNWYFDGRATSLFENVLGCLDPKWVEAVKWPIEEIGISMDCVQVAVVRGPPGPRAV